MDQARGSVAVSRWYGAGQGRLHRVVARLVSSAVVRGLWVMVVFMVRAKTPVKISILVAQSRRMTELSRRRYSRVLPPQRCFLTNQDAATRRLMSLPLAGLRMLGPPKRSTPSCLGVRTSTVLRTVPVL
ncbi:hypothetical protein AOZ06_04170 [Kibdelosporangium phytohabitans]|uniref:Uncharacterized protein n=1 Tax=Kibdelosporangium phytohabitans TaxID=860235 RepID=A0A0N9HWL0_9PSEU|nr:hypothetical protein AOZ06_04170 [Kibdelosporangium phytohabitans]